MATGIKYIRVIVDKIEQLCPVKTIKANSLNIDAPVTCPKCLDEMRAILEVIQYGYLEDKFVVLFRCAECNVAYWYAYTLALIELTEDGNDARVMDGDKENPDFKETSFND